MYVYLMQVHSTAIKFYVHEDSQENSFEGLVS